MARPVKQVRTLHERLLIIEEVERCPGEKRVSVAKRLGIAPSTLNSIMAKKKAIREQAEKCGRSCTKRKTGKESSYSQLETILISWYQQARAANIPINGTVIREKAKQIAAKIGEDSFTASNGWITRFKDRHGIVYKKSASKENDDRWRRLVVEPDVDYEAYALCDNEMVSCGMESPEPVCDDQELEVGKEDSVTDDEHRPKPIPTFIEAYHAFERLKTYIYAYSFESCDREALLKLETSLLKLRKSDTKKQLKITDFFEKK